MSEPTPRLGTSADRAVVALFAATMILSAALLFLVQPMVARFILPALGGTPTVWTTSQMFFQFMLLGGYVYAHASIRYLGPRRQALLHGGLLLVPLIVLPLSPDVGEPGSTVPAVWLVGTLLATVGLPFFVVSATAPLVQRWLAGLDHPRASDPYFLYRASNVGSVVGLLGYPFLLEPQLGLVSQGTLWSVGYGVLVVALLTCVATVWRYAPAALTATAPTDAEAGGHDRPVAKRQTVGWVALAALPSSLMLGTTTFLSTDIAPFPLLWVLPLGIYLFTFVVGFGSTPRVVAWVAGSQRALPVVILVALLVYVASTTALQQYVPVYVPFLVSLVTLFVVGLACHGRLASLRPPARQLTGFYIWVSIGGAVGGTFNALAAPQLFNGTLEYPLALGLAALASAGVAFTMRRTGALACAATITAIVIIEPSLLALVVGGACLTVAAGAGRTLPRRLVGYTGALVAIAALTLPVLSLSSERLAARDFFGSVRVTQRADGSERIYQQGTTIHGIQELSPKLQLVPTSYYHPTGPIGDVVREARRTGSTRSVAITGLGAGTLACLGARGERWRFFEIAPLSIRIASDPRQFTFLRDCPATSSIVEGDARIKYRETPGRYGLVIMDAFSSDSIPVHLLTREAVRQWFSRMPADGLLAYHISNRRLDLLPPVANVAASLGLRCLSRYDNNLRDASGRTIPGKTGSQWTVLARSEAALGKLAQNPDWSPCPTTTARVWTDDYSNVLSTIR